MVESEIQLDEYNHFSTLSNSNRTGGLIVYFNKLWQVNLLCEIVCDSKYWITAYNVKYQEKVMIIAAVYRSPSSQEADFYEAFEEVVETICERNADIIITGDFNVDWDKSSCYKNKLEQIFNDNGLKQLVQEFTRVTNNSRTIIDYVISNSPKIKVNNSIKNKISDHEIIEINVEHYNTKLKKQEIDVFKYNKRLFNREIRAIMKFDESSELNSNVFYFDECLESTIRNFCIKKTISGDNFGKKWFNRQLRHLKYEKIRKYNKAKVVNTELAWSNYKIARNIYKAQLNREKTKYINNKISFTNNQKEMWKNIKNLVLKKSYCDIQSVIFSDIEYKNSHEIAENFNNYFVNSIKEIRDNIETVQYINNVELNNTKFEFHMITTIELKNICKSLKKKDDYNKVNINIILDNWDVMGNILLNIINKSLETGIFPESWKTSMITPIEKITKARNCEDFRPINTLKLCEKILEKVVKVQLEEYLEGNNILSKYQSGFRGGFSCETAVNYVINRWKNIDKNKKVMAMFLDFKRAFETIDRDILIKKLFNYGIRNIELKWFQSYLTNRTQITKVNNVKSNKINNEYGVPQGSVLGALLFIIYINDLPSVVKRNEIVLYADDTLIFNESETDEQCNIKLMEDMINVNTWLKMNKLKLNENKTKIMEINVINSTNFEINNKVIEKVDKIKYLGCIIDKHLNFKDHIEYLCKKVGKKIGFFKRIRKKVTTITAINIYNAIIKPHFEFCSTILYTCCADSQLERMQKLQNKAMRSIIGCNRFTPIQHMLQTLKWLDIRQRLQLNTLLFIHKMKMGLTPKYLTEQLRYVNDMQPYHLRNGNDFRVHKATNNMMKRCLFYKGLQLFNMLPNEVKAERNINLFKRNCIIAVKNNFCQSFNNV